MKNLKKLFGIFFLTFLIGMLPTRPLMADEGRFVYESATNTYTLQVDSGDNITNALQNAIDEANGTSAKPAVIVIPGGSYSINLIKLNKSYITIQADNAAVKFVGSTASGQYVLKATEISTTGIKISGGTWDGAGKANVVFNFGTASVAAKNLTVENCTVKGGEQGVKVQKGNNVTFRNVILEDANYGLFISNSRDVKLDKCTASDNDFGYGLRSLQGTNTMNSCYAFHNSTAGLQVKDVGTAVTINGGKFYENKNNGISMTAGSTVTMNNAEVYNNTSNGISPVGSKTTATILTAKNCSFNNNGRHGVAGASWSTINMTDCEANGNKVNGIMLNKYCKSSGIEDCTTNQNGAAGILIQNSSTCKIIKNCQANQNKKLGISVTDVDVTIENCKANSNAKHGIYISNLSGNNAAKTVVIKNSQANSNKVNGICITEKKKVTITGTQIKNNQQSGVESKAALLNIKGSGNVISGNKKYGAYSCQGKMYISKAQITKNKVAGVYYVGTATSGYCINSVIKGNQSGIVVHKGAAVTKINGNTITGSKKNGIMCSSNPSGRKTTIKQCKNNKLSNPDASAEIYCYGRASLPSGMKNQESVTVNKTVKAGKKQITGKGTPGQKLKIKVGNKTNTVTVKKNGNFKLSTSKLKKNTKINIVATDKNKNTFTISYTVK